LERNSEVRPICLAHGHEGVEVGLAEGVAEVFWEEVCGGVEVKDAGSNGYGEVTLAGDFVEEGGIGEMVQA